MNKYSTLFLLIFLGLAIKSNAQVPNTLSPAQKIYGLSKIWQEVNYNFIYYNRIDKKAWDSTYLSMITEVQQTKNDYEYYMDLKRFMAFLKDGHSTVIMPPGIDTLLYGNNFGPYWFHLDNIDGKVIITHEKLSMKDKIPIGSEITEINGITTSDYMRTKIEPYISSSTDYILSQVAVYHLFEGFKGETWQVKIRKPDGKTIALDLTHAPNHEKAVFPPYEEYKLFEFKWYDHDIAYLALNSFDDPKIDTLFLNILPKLYKAKGLIIDIRDNGGGSTDIGTNILKYLTKDSLLYGEKVVTRLNNSYYRAVGGWIKSSDTIDNTEYRDCYLNYYDKYYHYFPFAPDTVKLKTKRIEIPTAILTGNFTASAAEDFLIYADKCKNMIRIGEKTYGSTGMPYVFNLPGGGSARVCTVEDTYSDGREFVGYGVIPNIEVKSTVQDFIDHKDPVMDKALEYLEGKIGR